jgi:hypothetical protein
VRRFPVFIGLALCLSTTAWAQETTKTPPEPGPIAESADRIAREWWPTDQPTFAIDEQGRPRFRGNVTETMPPPPWQPTPDLSPVPALGAISHQEMLRQMTPQEFSTPPLVGASVDPGSIVNGFKKAWRDWEARKVHERVMKELEELNRLNREAEAAESSN